MRKDGVTHRGRVLIVEDEALIGLTLADLLKDEGFRVVGPVGNRSEAVAILDRVAVDAVILDLGLQDGVCVGLACELQARSVPFVIFSGHRRESFDVPALRDVTWFDKPGHADEIINTLAQHAGASLAARSQRLGAAKKIGTFSRIER